MEQKDLLRSRRLQLGLTQLEVAKAVGVSEATVSRWESGDIAEVGSGKIAALAQALDLDPGQVVGASGPTAPSSNPPPRDELGEYLEQLRTRPEMRAYFSLAKNASKSEVEDAMRIVEAYFAGRQAGRQEREDE